MRPIAYGQNPTPTMKKITKSYLKKAMERLSKSCEPRSDAIEFSNALSDYVDAMLEFYKKPTA